MNTGAVEEIKARLPIEEVVGSYVKLEKAGRSFKAKCPFHNEKTASFFVSPERSSYYCFGCNAKGDIFSFVEQFEGLDFRGALKVLAEKAGVPLVHNKQKDESEKDRLFAIVEDAAKYFEAQYEGNKEAKEYVKNRGISPDTRSAFRIGFAPLTWKNLLIYLKGKGWNESLMEKAGLIKKREESDGVEAKKGLDPYYDRFRGRIMFPITDSSGRVVAFTGRILKDDGKSAKYLNSPETPLFNKSQILFGLDKAKTEIRRAGYSVLVEGQMDLVLSHQVGIKNAIAASGTALTDQSKNENGAVSNLVMVRRLSSNMIIALDSDSAGRTAAMKAVAATAISLGMSVKIADIKGGKDPADLILSDPESWKKVLKDAKHVIEFELGNVLNETKDPHRLGKALRERVFPFLARIESEMDKAYYVKLISEKSGLTEPAVWDDLRRYASANQSPTNAPKSGPPAKAMVEGLRRIDLVERRIIGLLSLMEAAKWAKAGEHRAKLKEIAGTQWAELEKRSPDEMRDAGFEAEALFGTDPNKWEVHMKELTDNYEEDLLNDGLMEAMRELKIAEKNGEKQKVDELAKKCQALSVRKAVLSRKKKA